MTRSVFVHSFSRDLRGQLLLLVGLTTGLLMLIIGVGVVYFANRAEAAAWRGRQSEAARHAAQIVSQFIVDAQQTLVLMGVLGQNEWENDPDLMLDLLQQDPALQELILVGQDGRIVANASSEAPVLASQFTLVQAQWFLDARANGSYLGPVQISAQDEPYLIVARAFANDDVIAARIRLNLLWDTVADIRLGETGQAYVVNANGRIIAHTKSAIVLANISLAGRPEVRAAQHAPDQTWYGEYTDFQGTRVVGAIAPVPGTDWLIITQVPVTEAFAISRTALVLFGIGLGVLAFVGTWISRRRLEALIVRPLEDLRVGAERIGRGDFSYRLRLERNDELGQVAQAFDEMANRLQGQQAQLTQRAAEQAALFHISLNLTASLNLSAVLDSVLTAAFTLLPQIQSTQIFLYDAPHLTFAGVRWADGRHDRLIPDPRAGGVTEAVARLGAPAIVPDIAADPYISVSRPELRGAIASLPLKIGPRVVGVIHVYYASPHPFAESELQAIYLLGGQAAIAIENARLYGQAQQELAERQRAEDSLRESEARLNLIIDNAPIGFVIVDLEGMVRRANRAYCDMLGYSPDELLGRTFSSLTHPDDKAHNLDLFGQALRGEITRYHLVKRYLHKDGHPVNVSINAGMLRDKYGQPIHTVALVEDISQRLQTEEAMGRMNADLQAHTQELARSKAELERFTTITAHHLQEPLRQITTYTQLLAQRYHTHLDAEADEVVGYVVDGAARMRALLKDVLAYLEVGGPNENFATVACELALTQARHRLVEVVNARQVEITSEPLPTVLGSLPQLINLFYHLLENAIKFNRAHPPRIQITATRRPVAEAGRWGAQKVSAFLHPETLLRYEWVLAVCDNGIGIEADYFKSIFEIFERLHPAHVYPGTGIGLALCKKIVERHGGRMWVESQVGVGTTCYFTLPDIQVEPT